MRELAQLSEGAEIAMRTPPPVAEETVALARELWTRMGFAVRVESELPFKG
jgi:hypothetical protein